MLFSNRECSELIFFKCVRQNLKMYFLIVFLSFLVSTCTVPVQPEEKLEEMILIDCNSKPIANKLDKLTIYFESLEKSEPKGTIRK